MDRHATKVPNLVGDYHDFHEPIGKIVFGDHNRETLRLLQEALEQHPLASSFDFIRSEATLFEILPKGSSKGSLLLKLAQVLHVDSNKTVAVGDYYNDISMIRAAKLGIAVSNACPEVKAVANAVTVSHEEDAIAQIIEDLDRGDLAL